MKIQVKDLFNEAWDLKEEYVGLYLGGVFKMEGMTPFSFSWMDAVGIKVKCPDGRGDTLYRYNTDYVEITKEQE